MAKDKKSFLLYCDLIHTVKKLSDEQAGKLLKHILSYVNDENPITDDIILDLVFEPIKQSLKRDLKKYENICNRNRKNGLNGGRPSNPDEPKEPSGLITNPNNPSKPDRDNDKDKGKDKDKFDYSFFGNYTDIMIEWVEYKKSIKDSYKSQKSLVACFENLKKLSNNNVTTAKDIIMQSMANNWKGLFELKNKPKSLSEGVGEFINADGNRTYGTSGVIVPNDAPPRPSNQHIWSKNEAKWKIQ